MNIVPAVIYARYSSSGQREESIEGQLRECRAYAKRSGFTVVGEYIDKAMTGRTDKRPDFQRMIRDSERGIFRAVICWKMDRFARNRYDSAVYKNRLKKNGVRLCYAREEIPDGAEGIMLEAVMEGMAEWYSKNLSENVKRGNYDSALELKTLGKKVLGLREGPDKRYEIDPATAPVVRRIFEEYAAGESAKEIYLRLNAEGYRTVRGGLFNKSSIRRILQNEKYIGVYEFKDIRVENAITPIVSRGLFDACQRLVERHHRAPAAKRDTNFLLTGKLFCGHCGAPMTGDGGTSKTGRVYNYYTCNGHRLKKCGKKREPQEPLEKAVLRQLAGLLVSDDFVEAVADQCMEYQTRERDDSALRALRARQAENATAITNLLRAIEAGILTPSTKARMMELEAERAEIEHGIAVQQLEAPRISREDVAGFLRRFRAGAAEDQEWTAFLVDSFLNAVFLSDDGTLVLALNYAGEQEPVTLRDIQGAIFSASSSCLEPSGAPNDADLNTKKRPMLHFFDRVAAVVAKFQK